MIYTVSDLQGNWLWTGWARDAEQAELLARGCNPSISSSEPLRVEKKA
jgi:hypothetical protein